MRGSQAAVLAEGRKAKTLTVETSTRACINCQYYEQYYRQNRGNVYGWMPTATGYCLMKECQRGAMRQVCKDFLKDQEKKECPSTWAKGVRA